MASLENFLLPFSLSNFALIASKQNQNNHFLAEQALIYIHVGSAQLRVYGKGIRYPFFYWHSDIYIYIYIYIYRYIEYLAGKVLRIT